MNITEKYKELARKPAGFRIIKKDIEYIKMSESIDHCEGCYFNTKTGTIIHASYLIKE